MSNITSAVERINSIDFMKPPKSAFNMDEAVLHMKEFLRRTLLWTKALNVRFDPLSCLALGIDESVELDPELRTLVLNKRLPYPGMKLILIAYLLWSMVEDQAKVKYPNLPPPYDPLLALFEHGGWFYQEQGALTVADAQGWLRGVSLSASFYDTDQSFLPSNQS